jgi:predicted TPR repeat methyltransferase
MLELLEKKAAGEGVTNIRTILCDVEKSLPEGTFSVICAFASFEYIADLPRLFVSLSHHLEPGGVIYFITARRSFLRFFIQLGNAVRQRMWLKAHSRSEIRGMLQAAGCEQIEINSHLFKVFRYGGMLLEVVARRTVDNNGSAAQTENL